MTDSKSLPLIVSNVLSDTALAILRRAGSNALLAADKFFRVTTNNLHTLRAYSRCVGCFLSWCEEQGLELVQITPGVAGQYFAELKGSVSTKNQALAALRHFFDILVTCHALGLNPLSSVRGLKHSLVEGKTPAIGVAQARTLLCSINVSHVVGLRDRAILGVLAYTGARIGAIARLRRGDLSDYGTERALRFAERTSNTREIPVRRDLDTWLTSYLEEASIDRNLRAAPLFLAAEGKRKRLLERPMTAHSMRQMLKRRLADAGLPALYSPHSFRVAVVTDLLNQDVPLEDVQYLAGHANSKTTQIYDRRRRQVTRSIVERISI